MNERLPDGVSGVLVVNKHAGVTSHDIVNRIRRLYGTKKVGHTGTLDPMATGVLVILVGRAVKASEYVTGCGKSYVATLRLGLETDTEDVTGEVFARCESIPDAESVKEVTARFVGVIKQTPPMYSALKVGGRKLVDLARQGQTVERQAREIEISSLDVTATDEPTDYILNVSCSGGTYIRTLCADIGKALGCGGVMATLERTRVSGFTLDKSHTLAEIEEMGMDERLGLLIPTESLFSELDSVTLPPFFERLFRSGCGIFQKKLGTNFPIGTRLRIYSQSGKFIALGEVKELDEQSAIKSVKMFDIE